ncbi:hypothetical protein QFC20_006064 [Naganishia adeliensis]|uniref:Uncharacterized protein n=1 Tax=Naganishia adeliensis TaxID=92952 RepID=A0ACC2VFB1_9TREE|nr:hypothetical protein QFC20_006064 [Naganishia adeliensis]
MLTQSSAFPKGVDLLTATIQELQDHLAKGHFSSVQLVEQYLNQIKANDQQGLKLRAMLDVAPKRRLLGVAQHFDQLRKQGVILSPLHGIPILVKDSIATDDELDSVTAGDATVIANLRAKGAIVIGKTNLSELSMFMGKAPNGLSARGGQCQSAYVAGGDPSGSSSGSAVGTSAGFAAAALGEDTYGALTLPAARNGLFSIKPTKGLVSRKCLIGGSDTFDAIGPMAKSAYDTALLLGIMAGTDLNDPSTSQADEIKEDDYTKYTLPEQATFKGKTLGVPRKYIFDEEIWGQWGNGTDLIEQVKKAFDQAVEKMSSLGATIVDPADVPSFDLVDDVATKTLTRLELKDSLESYLRTLKECKVRTLEELVSFNKEHAKSELPLGDASQQQLLDALEAEGTTSGAYCKAAAEGQGVDRLLDALKLDALVAPCNYRMVRYAALSGCPIATVPLGQYDNGAPFGLCFVGRKGSEGTLFALITFILVNHYFIMVSAESAEHTNDFPSDVDLLKTTVEQLQNWLRKGHLTSV